MKKIEKIIEYIDNEMDSVSDFERKSGLSNGYLTNTLARGADLSKKIENRIKEKNPGDYYRIFNEAPTNNSQFKPTEDVPSNNTEDPETSYIKMPTQEYIHSLKDKIQLLEEQNGFLKEQLLATLKRLETNYESSLKNQQELLAKVQAHIYASAKRFAGDDKRKLQLEMENMYNKAGEFLNYTHDSGKKDGS